MVEGTGIEVNRVDATFSLNSELEPVVQLTVGDIVMTFSSEVAKGIADLLVGAAHTSNGISFAMKSYDDVLRPLRLEPEDKESHMTQFYAGMLRKFAESQGVNLDDNDNN